MQEGGTRAKLVLNGLGLKGRLVFEQKQACGQRVVAVAAGRATLCELAVHLCHPHNPTRLSPVAFALTMAAGLMEMILFAYSGINVWTLSLWQQPAERGRAHLLQVMSTSDTQLLSPQLLMSLLLRSTPTKRQYQQQQQCCDQLQKAAAAAGSCCSTCANLPVQVPGWRLDGLTDNVKHNSGK
jgi:hypothetical protein